jgi:non-specific serine/threonine protein kinase
LFDPDALLARLEPRLELLTDGATDAPSRQQTLRATIAWSVDLLETEEQDTFAALAVFVGGFTAADAAAVALDVADPMAMLERLVDRSLLRVDPALGEPRFGMLETIREYAWGQVSEAQRADLRRRHLAHFVALVEGLRAESRSAGQGIAIRLLLAEQANIRAALVHARDNEPETMVRLVAALPRRFWYGGAGLREGVNWFEEAHRIVAKAPTPAAIRARLLQQGASMLVELGDSAQSALVLEESLRAAEKAGDDLDQFEAWIGLAYIALTARDLDVAQEQMSRAMSFARLTGHDGRIAEALVGLALVSRLQGDLGSASTLLENSIRLARSSDDAWVAAAALYHMADLERAGGAAGRARATLLEARDYADVAGDAELADWATIGLVRIATVLGRRAEARSTILEAGPRIRALGHPLSGLFLLDAASEWFEEVGLPGDSVEAFAAADRARTDLNWGDPPDEHNGRKKVLERVQNVVGPVRFQAGWATGQARSLGEALDVVISAVQSVDPEESRAVSGRSTARRLGLTVREQEIAALVAAGMSDSEVADALVISKKTVSVHVANVKGKLGARNRVEIATKAAALGLMAEDAPEDRAGTRRRN